MTKGHIHNSEVLMLFWKCGSDWKYQYSSALLEVIIAIESL